jgi:metal-sulfur cluster biosynthetic enzyme
MSERDIMNMLLEVVHPARESKSIVELGLVDSISVE